MPEIISTSQTDLSYILEVTPGITPATPTFQKLPIVSGGPQGGRTTATSEAIRTDRQKAELITVDQTVTGDIAYELSFDAYRPFLKSLMEGTEVVGTDTQADIAMDDSAKTITSAALADFTLCPAGSYVLVSGFADAGNNGAFRVVSSTALVITLHAQDTAGLVTEVAGASVTVSWNHVPNGVAVPDSYTIKKEVALTTKAYMYYRGCMVNTLAWTFAPGEILKGSIGILGLTEDVTETEFAGTVATTGVASYKLMNSVESMGFSSSGLQSDVQIENATLNYDNGIQGAKAIGTLGPVQQTAFTLSSTGDITLYFEDISAYTLFINETSFSLSFKFADADGNNIVAFLPNCKFTTVESPIPGKDNFFMINASFEALMDPTLGFTMGMNLLTKHA
jgi:hypothetical protein